MANAPDGDIYTFLWNFWIRLGSFQQIWWKVLRNIIYHSWNVNKFLRDHDKEGFYWKLSLRFLITLTWDNFDSIYCDIRLSKIYSHSSSIYKSFYSECMFQKFTHLPKYRQEHKLNVAIWWIHKVSIYFDFMLGNLWISESFLQ